METNIKICRDLFTQLFCLYDTPDFLHPCLHLGLFAALFPALSLRYYSLENMCAVGCWEMVTMWVRGPGEWATLLWRNVTATGWCDRSTSQEHNRSVSGSIMSKTRALSSHVIHHGQFFLIRNAFTFPGKLSSASEAAMHPFSQPCDVAIPHLKRNSDEFFNPLFSSLWSLWWDVSYFN